MGRTTYDGRADRRTKNIDGTNDERTDGRLEDDDEDGTDDRRTDSSRSCSTEGAGPARAFFSHERIYLSILDTVF